MKIPFFSNNEPEHKGVFTKEQEVVALYVESSLSMLYSLRRAKNNTDVVIAVTSFYRSITGRPAIGGMLDVFHRISVVLADSLPSHQSNDWITVLDDFHSKLHRVKGTVLGQKLIQVFNHTIAHTFYHKMGIEIDSEVFDKIERNKIRVNLWSCLTFADAIAGLLLFLAKQGRQALLTGNAECFFVDGQVASDFLLAAQRLRKDYEFLGNAAAVGIKIPQYLQKLDEAIITGRGIASVLRSKAVQRATVESMVLELETLKRRQQSAMVACSTRWCPVGIFLYGDAGVAKTFIADGLFKLYCGMRGFTEQESIMWPRNFDDKYWSGYRSHFVGILMDDVAKHKPEKMQGVDPTVGEAIGVVNSCAMITNQAEAQDKGKIPILSEWVGITSNVPDLNLRHYYECTYAVMRRFAIRIEPIVKEEWRIPGTTRIDQTRIPAGQYPDCWTFVVSHPVQLDAKRGEYQPQYTFPNYKELIAYVQNYYKEHIAGQERAMKAFGGLSTCELCAGCTFPKPLCECASEEGSVLSRPIPAVRQDVGSSRHSACSESNFSVGPSTHPDAKLDDLEGGVYAPRNGDDVPSEVGVSDEVSRRLLGEEDRTIQPLDMRSIVGTESLGSVGTTDLQARETFVVPPQPLRHDMPYAPLISPPSSESSVRTDKEIATPYVPAPDTDVPDAEIESTPDSFCHYGGVLDTPNPLEKEDPLAWCERLNECQMFRRKLEAKARADGFSKIFANMWIRKSQVLNDLQKELNLREGVTLDQIFDHQEKQFDKDLARFSKLLPSVKAAHLAGEDISQGEWLDFEPEIGRQRNFMYKHLEKIREILARVMPPEWDERHHVCLDIYVMEHVPQYLLEGWTDESIMRGMLSFVEHKYDQIEVTEELKRRVLFDREAGKIGITDRAARKFVYWFLKYRPFQNFCLFFARSDTIRNKIANYATRSGAQDQLIKEAATEYDMGLMGAHGHIKIILLFCAGATVVGIAAKLFYNNMCAKDDEKTDEQRSQELQEVGKVPVVREAERENVWNVPDRNITTADFAPGRPLNLDQIQKKVIRNCVIVETFVEEDGQLKKYKNRALVVTHRQIVMNTHCLPDNCILVVHLGAVRPTGCAPTVTFNVSPSMLRRFPGMDVTIITTNALPTLFMDLRSCIAKKSFNGVHPGRYYIKLEDGSMVTNSVFGITRGTWSDPKYPYSIVQGTPNHDTEDGDCGSPLVMETGFGPTIVGIHSLWKPYKRICGAVPIYYEMFDEGSVVQCGVLKTITPLTQDSKLFTDFMEEGSIMTHGATKQFRARNTSRGGKTSIADYCFENGSKVGLQIEDRLMRPYMDSWRPQQKALSGYLNPACNIDEPRLHRCADKIVDYIMENLTEEDKADIHPVPLDVAVNGYPAVPNIDSQKFSTSAGYGHRGAKKNYLLDLEDPENIPFSAFLEQGRNPSDCLNEEERVFHSVWQDYRRYSDDIEAKMDEMWESYCRGIRWHAIFTAQLKDEMVTQKKYEAFKTRVFFMCGVELLTLLRMNTLGLSRVMVRRKDIFKIAVGLNAHSEEWEQMYRQTTVHGTKRFIAGDFVGFDKIMTYLIMKVGVGIFVKIIRLCGNFSEKTMRGLETMLEDVINPSVDYFGEMLTFLNGEVSGHQLTTFLNCIVNLLLHVYVFETLREERGTDEDFFKSVEFRSLGDDVFQSVAEWAMWYNHTTIQRVFASINIEYTMADKESASVPFIPVEEVTFLKRVFAKHETFSWHVAPLEKESIYKMLCYRIASNSVHENAQLASACCSAMTEAFYHGKQFFDAIDWLIETAPKNRDLQLQMRIMPRPTWHEMVNRFLKASPNMVASCGGIEAFDLGPNQKDPVCSSDCLPDESVLQGGKRMDCNQIRASGRSPQVPIQGGAQHDSKTGHKPFQTEFTGRVENQRLNKNQLKGGVPLEYTSLKDLQPSVRTLTMKAYNRVYRRARWTTDSGGSTEFQSSPMAVETSAVPETADSVTTSVDQTTVFANEPVGEELNMHVPFNQVGAPMKMDANLGEFLKRPTQIYQYRWVENGAAGWKFDIYPWDLYFNTPAIKNKLQGFKLLRANLKIKILVNGSPFYYGRLGMFYRPMARQITDTCPPGTVANLYQIPVSQRPGIYVDPQSASVAEMTLPFFWPYAWVDTALRTNLQDLGTLSAVQFAELRSANGVTTTGIDITIYAWAEDFELAGPTAVSVLQSGKLKEMSSAASKVAKQFASRTLSAYTGGISEMLGFTNDPVVSDVAPMKPTPFTLSTAEIGEPVGKLSLDHKQAIGLGSGHCGGPGVDELDLRYLLTKESFLAGALWTTTNATNDVLFSSAVTPMLYDNNGTQWAHTPMSYFSQLFQYWRGSIIFRFKVVRSQYHRGRINICWDVGATTLEGTPTVGDPSVMNVVMDLDVSDEVEIEVPYTQWQTFLNVRDNMYGTLTRRMWKNAAPAYAVEAGIPFNGVITARVMNRLTAPESTSDVDLLVYVRAGDDFKLAAPVDIDTRWLQTSITNSVLQSEGEIVFGHEASSDNVYKEVFGENITSLRALLHRSSQSSRLPIAANSTGTLTFRHPLKHLPRPRGWWNNAWDSAYITGQPAASAAPFNFVRNHPINWVANCFIGWKGSVNVTVNHTTGLGTDVYAEDMNIVRVPTAENMTAAMRRYNGSVNDYNTGVSSTKTAALNTMSLGNIAANLAGATGMILTNQKTNVGLAANLPYYSNSSFNIVDLYVQYSNQDSITDGNSDWYAYQGTIKPASTTNFNSFVDVYYGTGPDFDLVYFLSTPLVYFRSVTATST